MIPRLAEIQRILLHEWDPIGVADSPDAADEYDSYAFQIFTMLKSRAAEADIARYLDRVQSEHMALPPTPDHNRRIAAAVARLDGA